MFIVLLCVAGSHPVNAEDVEVYQPRIANGTSAETGRWPWMVALLVDDRLICGGTLVRPSWVLTAAHCVAEIADVAASVEVRAGHVEIPRASRYRVSAKFIPNSYEGTAALGSDIALLQLEVPIPMHHMPTLRLSDGPTSLALQSAAASAVVLGWGVVHALKTTALVERQAKRFASSLQEGTVPLVPPARCAARYPGLQADQICAGSGDGPRATDTCIGDSGGPLLVKHEGGWMQVGVISYGYGCAAANEFGVYTAVDRHLEWILRRAGG